MEIVYLLILVAFFTTGFILVRSLYIKYKNQFVLTKASEKISDGYLIFNSTGKITNYNKAFMKNLNFTSKALKNKNVFEVFEKRKDNENFNKLLEVCKNIRNSNEIKKFEIRNENNIFKIEVKSIVNNDIFVRYVIICKDVTKTYEMIEELQNNQDILANREKFATLGQLVSGIVHSLKSPIFSISGDLEGINNLIKEYEESVGDKTVTVEDHYEIANDMTNWLEKMKKQVEDISDSITAVRSQVVTLNNEDDRKVFTVSELIKYIDILMKNTLKEYLIVLQFTVRIPKTFEIKGNLNALVQAVDNLIMNSVESYHGKTNQTIEIVIDKRDNKIEISVIDTGSGIPKRIQDKIFKEIITKDGTEKVGLGLFMAYSNIKAGFNRRHCLRIKI